MTTPTRHRVGDVFGMASRSSTMTSLKSQISKPHCKETSRKDKQTSWEHVPDPCGQDWLFFWVGIYSRDPESGSISHYINPLPSDVPFISQFKDDSNTSRATAWSLEGPFVFYWVEYVIIHHDFKTQKTVEPSSCPASITTPPPRRRRKSQNPWAMPWILQREERWCCRTLLDELITTHIPGYRTFTRIGTSIFLFDWRIIPNLRKSTTNFLKPLDVGLKLAVTLRHFSIGESHTSLQFHWRVERRTICKFIPCSAKPFWRNIWCVPQILKTGKNWRKI